MSKKTRSIQENLEYEIQRWEQIGHHALMQRFVLRNGRVMHPVPKHPSDVQLGIPRSCFKNAYELAVAQKYTYVEGYGMTEALDGFMVHHAWVLDKQGRVVDNTWSHSGTAQYIGVPIETPDLLAQTDKHQVYGIFDHIGLNADWMFEKDPALKDVVHAFLATQPANL